MAIAELPRSKWGIPEPVVKDAGIEGVNEIDVLVMPGVGFMKYREKFARIGQGAGYYDRWLENCCKKPVLVGVCFHEQIVDEGTFSPDPWDQLVDFLVTPDGVTPNALL